MSLQSYDGTTLRTHWQGWIESLSPKTNLYGERTVEIVCAGAMLFFEDAITQIALQEDKRTDELITLLLDQVDLPTPLSQTTLLNQADYATLNVSTLLPEQMIDRDLQPGKTTLAFAADNWVRRESQDERPDPFNVYRAMRDVVAAERGRFFFSRMGKALFWNRHHSVVDIQPEATFDDTMTDLSYTYAERGDFANHVTVTYHPRTISPDNATILWQLEEEVTVAAGQTREMAVAYRDESQNRIGGVNIYLGEFSFSTGSADISLRDIGANRITLVLRNRSQSQKVVLASCVVRGQKITDFGEMEAERKDALSISLYGKRPLDMRLQAVDDSGHAESIAIFELNRRKDPSGHVQSMTLRSHGFEGGLSHEHQLALTIGDGIKIKETQTNHTGDYFIIGERQRLTAGATLLETTWQLEPVVYGDWFKLNEDALSRGVALLY